MTPPTTNPRDGGHARTPTHDGGYIENHGNHEIKFRADGSREYMRSGSRVVQYRRDGTKAQETRGGRVTDFHTDGSHSVSRYGQPQYTQRTIQTNGRTTIQRTYTRNNATYVRNYNTYVQGGYTYHAYVPVMAYDPWFYSYCYHPWYDPYPYTWGWARDPWFGYYGYYYRPYPTYYGPAYWLTDFILSDILAAQYADRLAQQRAEAAAANQAANQAADQANQAAADARAAAEAARLQAQNQQQTTPISQEIKDQIKLQVEEAIRAHERREPLPLHSLMQDTRHIFALTDDLEATITGTEQACSLTAGDLIRLAEVPAPDAVIANMVVVTSKRGSCPATTRITVSMADLQEYQNQFMETLDRGLEKMKAEVADKKK